MNRGMNILEMAAVVLYGELTPAQYAELISALKQDKLAIFIGVLAQLDKGCDKREI